MEVLTIKQENYLRSCITLSLCGWLPLLFVQPMIHGGSLTSTILGQISIVVSAYCTLEWLRRCKKPHSKLLVGAWLLTYASLITFGLYYAIPMFYHYYIA